MISGRTSTGTIIPVLVDAQGQIIISGPSPSVINPVGFAALYSNLNLAAGTNSLVTYTIPTGQRMKLLFFSIRYVGTVAGVTLIPFVAIGGVSVIIDSLTPITNGTYYAYNPGCILNAGDDCRCTITGATLNDDFEMRMAFERTQ